MNCFFKTVRRFRWLCASLMLAFLFCGCKNLTNINPVIREDAVAHLTDQEILTRVALYDGNLNVRIRALQKLNEAGLEKVAANRKHPGVRLAAEVRLGRNTWIGALSDERIENKAISEAMALAAGRTDVTAACHAYIRQGDDKRIPLLKELLNRYGDKLLAEDYLNCGQGVLSAAANAWATRHGYNIRMGSGSSRVRWGSEKR
jgi:hypothetical protein